MTAIKTCGHCNVSLVSHRGKLVWSGGDKVHFTLNLVAVLYGKDSGHEEPHEHWVRVGSTEYCPGCAIWCASCTCHCVTPICSCISPLLVGSAGYDVSAGDVGFCYPDPYDYYTRGVCAACRSKNIRRDLE